MTDRTDVNNLSKVGCSINKTHVPKEGSKFDYNLPRPPVPGEEKSQYVSDWGQAPRQADWATKKSSEGEVKRSSEPFGQSSLASKPSDVPPQLPPRPEALQAQKQKQEESGASSSKEKDAPPVPPCIRWAQSLLNLLNDSDGVAQFMDYLEGEGPHHASSLRFWLACEGVRRQDQQDKAQQYAQAIFSIFVQSPLLPIGEDLRAQISSILNSDEPLDIPVTVFDEAQLQVENEINATTYPNFLQSEIYLQCLQAVQNSSLAYNVETSGESNTNESVSARELEGLDNLACPIGSLPTVHEDLEFVSKPFLSYSQTPGTNASTGYHTPNLHQPLKLTKDLLLLSQQHRAVDLRPQSEAYASLFLYRNMGAHAAYNSYNPVSRQDSEMQSLSSRSDVRTESDNISMTDSSVDGRNAGRTIKRKAALEAKRAKESAAVNRETHMHQTIIPRTQRFDARKAEPPRDPQQFANILIKKLETISEKDVEQELDRRRKESESMSLPDDKHRIEPQSRALANVLKEKLLLLQPEDDDDQDILDQHVSRVFSDLTPSRSPGVASPRPHSPHRSRYPMPLARPKRRDKDGYSTFSGDSGNVHDFQDGSEHRLPMVVKSKSTPVDYADDRFARGSTTRRSASKKTLTDLTDSGVSVVSDTPPVVVAAPVPALAKDSRVIAWLMESDRSSKSQSGPHSEVSGKHRSHRTSPISSRHRTKGFGSSRSNSLERGTVAENLGPAQPFVADPNMPPPPLPSTIIQLEEARRRLMDEDFRTRSRVRSSNKYYPDLTQSGQSTLRKSTRGVRPSLPGTGAATPEEYTTVVFSFADEQFPYRIKIPGSQVTFRQFKEYLPKKGNYRYFFKTVCEELGNQVIQEEVNRDNDVLPLCEGKVMALAKPID